MPLVMFYLVVLSITERQVLKSSTIVVDLYINTQAFDCIHFNSLNIYFINVETLLLVT